MTIYSINNYNNDSDSTSSSMDSDLNSQSPIANLDSNDTYTQRVMDAIDFGQWFGPHDSQEKSDPINTSEPKTAYTVPDRAPDFSSFDFLNWLGTDSNSIQLPSEISLPSIEIPLPSIALDFSEEEIPPNTSKCFNDDEWRDYQLKLRELDKTGQATHTNKHSAYTTIYERRFKELRKKPHLSEAEKKCLETKRAAERKSSRKYRDKKMLMKRLGW